jgi:hypothetical protein
MQISFSSTILINKILSFRKYSFIHIFSTFVICFFIISANAQTTGSFGINTPAPKATLEVVKENEPILKPEGIIAPKVALSELKSITYGLNQTAAIVYVTNTIGFTNTQTVNIVDTGYYYFDGTLWQTMGGQIGPWNISSTPSTRATLIGQSMYHNGNVGIGDFSTSSPTANLHVKGQARIENIPNGGTSMLTTDGNGNIFKQPIPSPGLEVDGDITNEIQTLSIQGDTLLSLDKGGGNVTLREKWIYLPPFFLDVTPNQSNVPVDLYQHYLDNFSSFASMPKSAGAPNQLPNLGAATDFEYIITHKPSTVTVTGNTISASGQFIYSTSGTLPAPNDSWVTVILIRR